MILIAVAFSILLYGEVKHHLSFQKLGLLILIVAALFTIPTHFSGEGAELVLKDIGVMDHDLHELVAHHETLGFFSAMLAYGLGIFSLISLFMIYNTHAFFSSLRKLIILCAAGGMILLSITAHSGGEIRHPETSFSTPSE